MPRIPTLLVALAIGAASAASALGLPLVAIDPGHGGADSGAVGSLPPGTVTGLTPRADAAGNPLIFEKDVNLDVGQRLNAFLQANGVPTLMTRNADSAGGDVPYVSEGADLTARTDLANARAAQLFVSIHQNSAPSALGTGTETYVLTGTGPAPRALALAIQQSVIARLLLTDRGVREANFYVLRCSAMPAVLVEGAFLSNPTDALAVASPDVRQGMAEGIGTGVLNYAGMLGAGVVQQPVRRAPAAACNRGMLGAGVVQQPVPTRITLARSGGAVTRRAGIDPLRGDLWVATVTDQSGVPMAGVPLTARLPNGKGVSVSTRGDGKALLAVPRRRGRLNVAVAIPGIRVSARGDVPARIR